MARTRPGQREERRDDAAQQAAALSDDLRVAVWIMARRMRGEVQGGLLAEVPLGQQAVLALLGDTPGMTSAELARAEFVRPQSMNKTVLALREAGHVETATSAADARRHELHLTDSGRELLREIRALRGDWLTRRIEDDLDDTQRATLLQAAQLMRSLASDAPR